MPSSFLYAHDDDDGNINLIKFKKANEKKNTPDLPWCCNDDAHLLLGSVGCRAVKVPLVNINLTRHSRRREN